MATYTIVITYTAPDLTGPVTTLKPLVTSMTLGGTAYGSLSAAEVTKGVALMRDAASLLTTDKAPADGIDPKDIT